MFRESFEPSAIQVIEIAGRPIGFTRLVRQGDELYLAEVQISGKYRNNGIGTAIVRAAIAESERLDALLTLKVIKGNPAESLYTRLGFRVYAETAIHRKMSRMPGASGSIRRRL
jgi:ribosomal protein S18 acetylase RimI-like enzyme